MFCQACGIEAPTKYVAFYQNIGALIMRFSKSVQGDLCKSCIHKYFWEYTLINLLLGWWGMISLFVTPFFLLNNIGRYLFCLGMAPVPPDAEHARLTEDAIERMTPHLEELFGRLNNGEKLEAVASDIAQAAGVTPGQVALFVHAVIESQSDK